MCSAVEEFAKEYAKEYAMEERAKTKAGIVETLLKKGFSLTEALEIADLDEETYNKYRKTA